MPYGPILPDDPVEIGLGLSLAKFDRATFWLDMASRQWDISVSAAFAAYVSAIEALTERGDIHQFNCPICNRSNPARGAGRNSTFQGFRRCLCFRYRLSEQRRDVRFAIGHPSWQQAHRNRLRPGVWMGPALVEPARAALGSLDNHADRSAQLAQRPTLRGTTDRDKPTRRGFA